MPLHGDMDYGQCLDYLNRLGNEVLTMKFGLDTIRTLLGALDNPQEKFASILIAGTNGKGSVARFLSAILCSAGFRTGLYTSPHLVRVEERIAVDGRSISDLEFSACLTKVDEAIRRLRFPFHPTFFETLTATGFLCLARQGVDVAVVEVGMGGRLDSTNVLDPLLCIITPVSLDHQQYLGSTLGEIAGEKAGIIQPERPVLLAAQSPSVLDVLKKKAGDCSSPLHQLVAEEVESREAGDGCYSISYHGIGATLRMRGEHQVQNAALAIRAAELLAPRYQLSLKSIRDGIGAAWMPGRLQTIGNQPLVLLDGAHNREAIRTLVNFVTRHTEAPRALVFNMMRDKEICEIADLLRPAFDYFFVPRLESPRAAAPEQLLPLFPDAVAAPGPVQAIEAARPRCASVIATGSFYLVGEVLRGALHRPWAREADTDPLAPVA